MGEVPLELTVDDAQSGARLDRFLLKAVPGATPALVQRWLAAGAVRIRGKVPKPLRKLHRGDVVTVARPEPEAVKLAGDARIPVLFESASVVAVNKPAGLAVEPAGSMPSLVGALAKQLSGWDVGGQARPGVVHRLDKETTGCMLLARTDAAVAALHRAFDDGAIEKTYLVVVLGEALPEARLDTPYTRDPRDPRRYTSRVSSPRRARLSYVRRGLAQGCSLLEVRLETGRTHQIRVQLADARLPVLGDGFYGPRDARAHPLAFGRQALHAWKLSFPNPSDGQRVSVVASLPDDLRALTSQLGIGVE
jgi:23S rRNA pseudouridine1911/1915/1917 synthase